MFGALFVLIIVAALAAPLYASGSFDLPPIVALAVLVAWLDPRLRQPVSRP